MKAENVKTQVSGLPTDLDKGKRELCADFLEQIKACFEAHDTKEDGEESLVTVKILYNLDDADKKSVASMASEPEKNIWLSLPGVRNATEQDRIKASVLRARLAPVIRQASKRMLGAELSTIAIVGDFTAKGKASAPIPELSRNLDAVKTKGEGGVNLAPQEPLYRLDQMVLPEILKQEIEETLSFVKYRHMVYENWEFRKIDPFPRTVLNFFGPPGTGKTMCAHGVAHALGLKILSVKTTDIESMYVSVGPKNLELTFEAAKNSNALLFFDEADAFLSRRISSMNSSADASVNTMRHTMLTQLNVFTGFVIFASNFVSVYDPAFESRIFKHLKFDLPDIHSRKHLLKKLIPEKVPFESQAALDEQRLFELAKLSDGFCGRDLLNAVRSSLFRSAGSGTGFSCFEDFRSSFVRHKEKKVHLDREKNSNIGALEVKIKESLASNKFTSEKVGTTSSSGEKAGSDSGKTLMSPP